MDLLFLESRCACQGIRRVIEVRLGIMGAAHDAHDCLGFALLRCRVASRTTSAAERGSLGAA